MLYLKLFASFTIQLPYKESIDEWTPLCPWSSKSIVPKFAYFWGWYCIIRYDVFGNYLEIGRANNLKTVLRPQLVLIIKLTAFTLVALILTHFFTLLDFSKISRFHEVWSIFIFDLKKSIKGLEKWYTWNYSQASPFSYLRKRQLINGPLSVHGLLNPLSPNWLIFGADIVL